MMESLTRIVGSIRDIDPDGVIIVCAAGHASTYLATQAALMGLHIRVGLGDIVALPAHFLHAEGNFQFWDPASRILFSGDLGVSLMSGADAARPVDNLAAVLPSMTAFHRRYMVSNQVLRLWADMVATLPIEMIAPQHGAPLVGPAIGEFIAWARELKCGIDLMSAADYAVPA